MVSANAECVSVSPTSPAVLVIVLWIPLHAWQGTDRYATEEELVNVALVIVQIPNSKAPHVRCVRLALVSVQSTRTVFSAELLRREKKRKRVLRNACILT